MPLAAAVGAPAAASSIDPYTLNAEIAKVVARCEESDRLSIAYTAEVRAYADALKEQRNQQVDQ